MVSIDSTPAGLIFYRVSLPVLCGTWTDGNRKLSFWCLKLDMKDNSSKIPHTPKQRGFFFFNVKVMDWDCATLFWGVRFKLINAFISLRIGIKHVVCMWERNGWEVGRREQRRVEIEIEADGGKENLSSIPKNKAKIYVHLSFSWGNNDLYPL